MEFTYKPIGVCSKQITMRLNGNIIEECSFIGGCSGNAQGVAALAKGADAKEIINKLKGIKCGYKNTSCPEQLAFALEQALLNQQK